MARGICVCGVWTSLPLHQGTLIADFAMLLRHGSLILWKSGQVLGAADQIWNEDGYVHDDYLDHYVLGNNVSIRLIGQCKD